MSGARPATLPCLHRSDEGVRPGKQKRTLRAPEGDRLPPEAALHH